MIAYFSKLTSFDRRLAGIGILFTISFSIFAFSFSDRSLLLWFLILLIISSYLEYLDAACTTVKVAEGRYHKASLFAKQYKTNFTFFIAALSNVVDIANTLIINAIFLSGLEALYPGLTPWSNVLSVVLTFTVMLSLCEVIPKNIAKSSPNGVVALFSFGFIQRILFWLEVEEPLDADVIIDEIGEGVLADTLVKLLDYKALVDDKSRRIFEILTKESFLHPNVLFELSFALANADGQIGVGLNEILEGLKINYNQKIVLRRQLKDALPRLKFYGITLADDERIYVQHRKSS